jgi:hypothetical protein
MNLQNASLADLVASRLALTQETMDKVQLEENDVVELKMKIKKTRKKIESESSAKKISNIFIDYVISVIESNTMCEKRFLC